MNTCYTIITNDYDTLKEPFVSDGWEYICLSDKPIESDVWQYRRIDCHNREPKIMAHEYFEGLTLFVDGSIQIVGDLNEFISQVPGFFTLWKHPHRSTVWQEGNAIVKLKGCSKGLVDAQLLRYESEGFVDDSLAACGIILRDLDDVYTHILNEDWWEEFNIGVDRDQLSVMYVFWKNGLRPDLFSNEIFHKFFKWGKHK